MNSRTALLEELRSYVPADAREQEIQRRMIAFVAAHHDAFARTLTVGHITASAWVVDPARTRTLLTQHRKLGKWLQLGGHLDRDTDVRAAALREAQEESGLRSLRLAMDAIYDLDVHRIPARGSEPAHDHHDVRFAFEADPLEPLIVSEESRRLAWVALDDLASYGVDESVLRLARKTKLLGAAPARNGMDPAARVRNDG